MDAAGAHPWKASRRDRSRHRQGAAWTASEQMDTSHAAHNTNGLDASGKRLSSRQPRKSVWMQVNGKWVNSSCGASTVAQKSGPAKAQPALEYSEHCQSASTVAQEPASTKALPSKSRELATGQHGRKNKQHRNDLIDSSLTMPEHQASKGPAATVRASSESPRSPQSPTAVRSKSLPGGKRSAFIEASIKAAVSQLRLELDVLVENLVATAYQAHEAGSVKPEHVSSFRQGYSKTMRLLQEIHPAEDPAPELALNLILKSLSKSGGSAVLEKPSSPPADMQAFQRAPSPSIVANLPTPFRNTGCFAGAPMQEVRDLRGNAIGWTFLGTHVQGFNSPQGTCGNGCMDAQLDVNQRSAHLAQTLQVGDLKNDTKCVENNAVGWNSKARDERCQDFSSCIRSPRKRKLTVINPRTGEKLVISSVVPFSWRHSRRLRILNPKTGEEVLPLEILQEGGSCLENGPRKSRLSAGNADTPTRQPRRSRNEQSLTPARQQRHSLAGGTIKEGSCWFLEPASGGHWDWPLSRQEKKDRVLLLSQLELLSQIEELEARPGPT